VAVILTLTASLPAPAQDAGEPRTGSSPELAAQALTVHEAMEQQTVAPEVDVGVRFEEFQRDFEEDFGVRPGGDPVVDLGERVAKAAAKRWEGTSAYRLYERLEGVYDRFEGFYERLESSARWASSGFEVEPDLEAAVDGKVRVHVERRIGTFDMGLDLDDAIEGKLGLRLGGMVRGYKVSFDARDIVQDGRISFQVRKMRW